MNKYYVTFTYIATVEADNADEAMNMVEADIVNGDLYPNDVEYEEFKGE